MLTKEEKLQLINSHMRNLEYRKYGIQLDILVENAKSSPNADALASYDDSIDDIDSQIAALNAELATVNALTE